MRNKQKTLHGAMQRSGILEPRSHYSTIYQQDTVIAESQHVTPEAADNWQIGSESQHVTPEAAENWQIGRESQHVTPEAADNWQIGSESQHVTPEAADNRQIGSESQHVTPEAADNWQIRSESQHITPEGQRAVQGHSKVQLSANSRLLVVWKSGRKLIKPFGKMEEIFNLIPPEINAKNKRFILKRLNKNAKYERYEESFLWLKNAGVAIPVYNVEEPKVPLLLARSRNLLKLFLNDIGLLAAQYADGIQVRIIKGDKDINFGSIYENAVVQELVAHGLEPYYYNSKKRGEINFVIENNGKVLPIEVKSGKDYVYHRALSNIMDCDEYNLPEALVLNNDNLTVDGRITYLPVYIAMFLEKKDSAPVEYKVDLGGLSNGII